MTNVGSVDRALRILFGILLVIAVFIPQIGGLLVGWGSWKYVVTAVGLVLLATGALRICPAYSVLGINTCEKA